MSPAHTSHNHKSSSRHRHANYSSPKPFFRRPTRFASIRLGVYAFVFVWSIVALAIAVHFEAVLQSSDLTHFVPYALFASAVSSVAVVGLLALVLLFNSTPFAVKLELATSGVVGILWLGLSIFTASSTAEDAEVECFSDADDTDPIVTSFGTETFHAQYKVLTAAAVINTLFLLTSCAVLSLFTYRYYRKTKYWVTYTSQPLLDEKNAREKSRSSSRGHAPLTALPARTAKKTTNASATKEKLKALPLPAVAKRSLSGRDESKPVSTTRPSATAVKPPPAAAKPPVAKAPGIKSTVVAKPTGATSRPAPQTESKTMTMAKALPTLTRETTQRKPATSPTKVAPIYTKYAVR